MISKQAFIANGEELINRVFMFEPDACVNVFKNEKLIAVLFKDDWESGNFDHIRKVCGRYKPPETLERADIPLIGIVINIRFTESEGDT